MINGTGAGTKRDFTNEERDALHADKGTSETLNTARRNAGQKGDDVAVRGDDKTLDQRLAANKTHVSYGEMASAAVHAVEIGGALGHIPLIGKALHKAPAVALLGAAAFVGTQVALAELQNTKDGNRDAATRDTLHAGMVMSLALPKGFVDQEVTRLGVTPTNQSPCVKLMNQIVGSPLQVTLQLHCDQGIAAAEDCKALGQSKEAFLAASPKVAERYATDAAFRAGFDGFAWADKNAPEDARQMSADVRARDVRYSASNVHIRS